MANRNKAAGIPEAALNTVFGVLMLLIFTGTVILEKWIDMPFPNTVEQPNAVFYLAAFALLLILYLVFRAGGRGHSKRQGWSERTASRNYHIALAVIFLVVAVLQIIVSNWMLLPQVLFKRGDFTSVAKCAWELANGGSLEGHTYFQKSPNNLNITIVLSWVFRIFGNQRAGIWVGALLTNASVILTSLAVHNICRRGNVAIAVAVVGEILVALSWRAFLPYSDNYGMIFIALMLWLYTTKLRPEIKVPLIMLCAACGSFIKITCMILLVALAICELLKWLRKGEFKLNIRRMALYAVSLVVLVGGMLALQNPIRRHYGFVPGQFPKGWQYMLMVGQNTKSLGAVSGSNIRVREKAIEKYGNPEDVNREFLRRAADFVKKRGLVGNLVFYESKLTCVYNDGYFHNIQSARINKLKGTFLYEVYALDGKYYQLGAMLMQTLWDTVLLTMALYCACRLAAFLYRKAVAGQPPFEAQPEQVDMNNLLKLIVIGVTVYVLCLEGRSKYLFMFLPAFLAAFGLMLHTVDLNVTAWRSRRRARNNLE